MSPTPIDYGLDPGYSKVIPVASVSDSRVRSVLRDTCHVTQAVQLALSAYADVDVSSANLADIASAPSLIGPCANIKHFTSLHGSRGYACF